MDKSLVIVHGVGDPLPGNALTRLLEGLTARGWTITAPLRIEHRHESKEDSPTFPVAEATVQRATATLTIREVYWGDLSRPKASLFGLVSALFDFIFGLRYMVTAATNELDRFGRRGAQCARAALWLARGPMLALNVVLAAICLTYVALDAIGWPTENAPLWAVLCGSAITAGAGALVRKLVSRLHWSPATGDCMVVLGVLAAVLGLFLRPQLGDKLDAFIEFSTDVMAGAAALMAVLALGSLTILARVNRPHQRGPLTVVAYCTALSMSLFTFGVVAVWLAIGRTIREDKGDLVHRCTTQVGRSLQDCLADPTVGTWLASRIEAGIHLLPWVVMSLGAMALAFVGVFFRNMVLRRRNSPRVRYILHPVVVVVGIVTSAAYGVFFLVLAISVLIGWRIPWGMPLEWLKPLALTFTLFTVGVVVTSARAQFLTALDLVLDVIAHFRKENEGFLGDGGEYVTWNRIASRFRTVVDEALKKAPHDLVVASHSQGTTIAAHVLGALEIKKQAVLPIGEARHVRLITMGSPIGHLYCHYFPNRYKLKPLAVASWSNLYRDDDFVGTVIEGLPAAHQGSLGPGSHADYWSDSRLIRYIEDAVLGAPPVFDDGFESGPGMQEGQPLEQHRPQSADQPPYPVGQTAAQTP